jgi:hypothetical protein
MGVPVTLSSRLTRAGLLIATAAAAATVAAGCGSQVATTTSAAQPASPRTASPGGVNPGGPVSTGSAALCSKQAAVTRLGVSRVAALPQNHFHFTFPARVTVSSPERARAVAAMVCGLPPMAQGTMNCPADWGVSYRLSFAAGSESFPVVTARAGGCGVVTGAGPVRRTALVPGFWTVLAHAMGVNGGAALQGTRPVIHDGGPVSG